MSHKSAPRYVKKKLYDMSLKARREANNSEGDKISPQCKDAAAVLVQFAYLAAETGEFSFEYDVSTYNKVSISKICELAREELGDVYLIVSLGSSKKTIRAEWGS